MHSPLKAPIISGFQWRFSIICVIKTGYKDIILPLENQFIKLECRDISFSALKVKENHDSIILRLYNYSNECRKAEIELPVSIKEAYITDLKEERKCSLEINDYRIKGIDFKAKEISTIEIVPV